ncbi:MAG: carotenoid biosynthesis protein [Flavobacteriales bacterium]|nr:carotenoid biosynthesis protein [Flavobacteriales bacterium]HCA83073.1 carotenoid biosynthesis protein [Flavobacteriales bacterium]HRE75681.1 carotenoid biosynthesis protein [Flavobacteriales bacterium]HRE97668.1 carotenoid biosynthesis protein [Flavobacteriales bacterium]HRJ34361.1 carotenoid biosynthesis protein [Flavobacteriales bacterium]
MNDSFSPLRLWIAIAVLVIFYAVGFWGFATQNQLEFASLTWVNLVMSGVFVFFPLRKLSGSELLVMISIFVLSFVVEMVGVMTGALFGEYAYGANLGWKMYEVPIVIGLNWLMLVYATQQVASVLFSHWLLIAFFGALLMTGMDFLIEPVAMKLDYWQWKDDTIPFRNYLSWFIFGFIFQVLMVKVFRPKMNPAAICLFVLQAVFFWWLGTR